MSEQKNRSCFCCFFVLFCFFDSAQAADNKIVRLTTGEWPPIFPKIQTYFSENSENSGIVPNIVTQAFAIEGYSFEYAFFPWKRSYELAKSGQYDGSAAFRATKERKQYFYFSEPIIFYQNVFFTARNGRLTGKGSKIFSNGVLRTCLRWMGSRSATEE